MKWVTRRRVHVNRTATGWLIRRYLESSSSRRADLTAIFLRPSPAVSSIRSVFPAVRRGEPEVPYLPRREHPLDRTSHRKSERRRPAASPRSRGATSATSGRSTTSKKAGKRDSFRPPLAPTGTETRRQWVVTQRAYRRAVASPRFFGKLCREGVRRGAERMREDHRITRRTLTGEPSGRGIS